MRGRPRYLSFLRSVDRVRLYAPKHEPKRSARNALTKVVTFLREKQNQADRILGTDRGTSWETLQYWTIYALGSGVHT